MKQEIYAKIKEGSLKFEDYILEVLNNIEIKNFNQKNQL